MSSLLTKSYLRTRFWLGGITIGLSILFAVAAGWQTLSSFKANGLYSILFTDLIEATNRFESEMARPSANDDALADGEMLSAALLNVSRLSTLLRFLNNGESQRSIPLDPGLDPAHLDRHSVKTHYGLERGTMPAALKEVWEGTGPLEDGLQAAIAELIVFGRRLTEINDRASPKYQAIANYVRNQIHINIWPSFHRALDSIGKGTAHTAQTGMHILGVSALAVLAVAVLNSVFILGPVARSVMANQEELVRERDNALASEKAKRDFLAMMSHELRTPLNAVLGFSNILLSSNISPKQRDYAQTIHSSGLTLLDLLNDILDISNIDTGTFELETSNMSMEDTVAEVISLLAPQAFAKRIEISAYIDPSLPEKLLGDVGRVRQILLKLAGNAIKFTESGSIAIEVRHELVRPDGNHNIHFSVIDTGIGIAPDQMSRIFEHFVQVDSSVRRKYNGAGLGLPICKELVQLMDGEIGVEHGPGAGSTFWFRISLADAVPPANTIHQNSGSDLTGRRCLIVDDNALNRRIFQLQLEAFGADVECAPDAQGAMTLLADAYREARPHHVAIIDHMMPGTDGLQLRSMIREHPQYVPLRLIISSSSGIGFDQQARALGFDAACPKPVVQETLILKVHELFKPAHAAVPTPNSELALDTPVAIIDDHKPRKPRLLVAEDNPINQRLVMTALQHAGYVVDLVSDGVEAVHAVQRLPYDVVLMDIRMPVMSGVEATQRIRSLSGPAAQRPIIAMTANTMAGDREAYLKAGMNDYIAKPIDFQLLLRKIESFLSGGEAGNVVPAEDTVRQAPSGANRV